MATLIKVCRKSGNAYKAVIRLRGIKPFSKTFKLRKDAKAWAERMERDVEASRAYGNAAARTMPLGELIRLYIHYNSKQDKSGISNLTWWKREYGDMKLAEIDRSVVRAALNRLKEEDASLKWSTNSGHQVKAVKCHNEVRNDNRNEKEKELHGRLQA